MEKKDNIAKDFNIFFLILFIGMSIVAIYYMNKNNISENKIIVLYDKNIELNNKILKLNDEVDRFGMYYFDKYNETRISSIENGWMTTGIAYKQKGFFVVWVGINKTRSFDDVLETCSHEYFHFKWENHFHP